MRLCYFGVLWACLCAFANLASAQVANCPLNVTGAAGAPKFAVDGMLLLRYAVGLRGQTMVNKISPSLNLSSVEGVITANLSRLDVDGDGAFTATDALIIARYLSGFRSGALLNGIVFMPTATRTSAASIGIPPSQRAPAPLDRADSKWPFRGRGVIPECGRLP